MAATVETIMDVIKYRLGREELDRLIDAYGTIAVEDALLEAGMIHSGCEEIGSSDVYYMVQSFKRFLEHP